MYRFASRLLFPLLAALAGSSALAQSPAGHVEDASARKATPSTHALIARQELFGVIPLSTHSEEARRLVELSLDKYENHLTDPSLLYARQAVGKDPHFALAYAAVSLASLAGVPDATALARAKALAPRATPDEQLLIRWITSLGDRDLLPAISAMNDLRQRYPKDKHITYLLADWLYYRQDYERSKRMLESILQLDPDFPPALNLLGYAYIQTGVPDPAKAIASLKHYAEVQPQSANPQDSLGEISRLAGDDQASLEHYGKAVEIDASFVSPHWGLGDTSTLMGNYARARVEYDGAIAVASNPRDLGHAEFQKALLPFWAGQPGEGRKALDALYDRVVGQKEPYSMFEVGFGRAILAENPGTEIERLRLLEDWLQGRVAGMADADRDIFLSLVLREMARIAVHQAPAEAGDAIRKLEKLASQSRDLAVENSYTTAHGYLMFAQGNFDKAVEELAADPRSVLALDQLADAQENQGDAPAAEQTYGRIKYMRSATVEWYLFTRGNLHAVASGVTNN